MLCDVYHVISCRSPLFQRVFIDGPLIKCPQCVELPQNISVIHLKLGDVAAALPFMERALVEEIKVCFHAAGVSCADLKAYMTARRRVLLRVCDTQYASYACSISGPRSCRRFCGRWNHSHVRPSGLRLRRSGMQGLTWTSLVFCTTAMYSLLGRKKEADATAQRLLALTPQVKGEEHPDAAWVRHCTRATRISAQGPQNQCREGTEGGGSGGGGNVNPRRQVLCLLPLPRLTPRPCMCWRVGQVTRDAARARGFVGDHGGKKALLLRALELQRRLFGRSYIGDLDYSKTRLFLASAHVMLGEVEQAGRCVRIGAHMYNHGMYIYVYI